MRQLLGVVFISPAVAFAAAAPADTPAPEIAFWQLFFARYGNDVFQLPVRTPAENSVPGSEEDLARLRAHYAVLFRQAKDPRARQGLQLRLVQLDILLRGQEGPVAHPSAAALWADHLAALGDEIAVLPRDSAQYAEWIFLMAWLNDRLGHTEQGSHLWHEFLDCQRVPEGLWPGYVYIGDAWFHRQDYSSALKAYRKAQAQPRASIVVPWRLGWESWLEYRVMWSLYYTAQREAAQNLAAAMFSRPTWGVAEATRDAMLSDASDIWVDILLDRRIQGGQGGTGPLPEGPGEFAPALRQLASRLLQIGDLDASRQVWQHLTTYFVEDPGLGEDLRRLALIEQQIGDQGAAYQHLLRSARLRIHDRSSPGPVVLEVWKSYADGLFSEQALADIQLRDDLIAIARWLIDQPGDRDTQFRLGVAAAELLLASGHPDQAREVLGTRCLGCAEFSPEQQRSVGMLLLSARSQQVMGEPENSKLWEAFKTEAVQRAHSHEWRDAALQLLAMTARKVGRLDEAMHFWQRLYEGSSRKDFRSLGLGQMIDILPQFQPEPQAQAEQMLAWITDGDPAQVEPAAWARLGESWAEACEQVFAALRAHGDYATVGKHIDAKLPHVMDLRRRSQWATQLVRDGFMAGSSGEALQRVGRVADSVIAQDRADFFAMAVKLAVEVMDFAVGLDHCTSYFGLPSPRSQLGEVIASCWLMARGAGSEERYAMLLGSGSAEELTQHSQAQVVLSELLRWLVDHQRYETARSLAVFTFPVGKDIAVFGEWALQRARFYLRQPEGRQEARRILERAHQVMQQRFPAAPAQLRQTLLARALYLEFSVQYQEISQKISFLSAAQIQQKTQRLHVQLKRLAALPEVIRPGDLAYLEATLCRRLALLLGPRGRDSKAFAQLTRELTAQAVGAEQTWRGLRPGSTRSPFLELALRTQEAGSPSANALLWPLTQELSQLTLDEDPGEAL